MSSNEDDFNDGEAGSSSQSIKKRRIQRACDVCRRKKIRCDGQIAGNRCSNCSTYNYECTYVEAAKKRGPPKGYVESLENRLEKLEGLLRKLCPDETVLRELDASLERGTLPTATGSSSVFTARHSSPATSSTDPKDIATSLIRNLDATPDDDDSHLILADNLRSLSIDPVDYRFFGKSSGAMLIQTAIELKNEYTGGDDTLREAVLGKKREEFWVPLSWEGRTWSPPRADYKFPDPDLLAELVDHYFTKVNLFLPLLHRPSFERDVAAGLHLKDDGFGGTLLLVCAIGSRFTEDPRVLLDGVDSFHSAGWRWFEQVQVVKKSLLAPPTLYDLQYYCLSVQFLQGSSAPQSCWTMVGIGIRLAQDVGAHRKKGGKAGPSSEDELWKRAFWVLVCMDRAVSSALGRPCAIQDEDFDLDMPIECDDEFWDTECDNPDQRWKQPAGKPSTLSAFIVFLKLNQILAFSLRTIYSINKSKILLGFVGAQWEQHIVAELDSTLNKWVDSIPDHLRWDPGRENLDFFNQSVVLYCAYYHIQILIHRPFIPSPTNPSPLSFPSLAICTNAARSCSHIIDVYQQRNSFPPPHVQMAVFTSAIVLLLSIWGGKRSGLSTDPNKEMMDVHKCMRLLRSFEKQWHSAGRLWDILYELASVGDLPLPQPSPPSNKRERDSETPISSPSASSEGSFAPQAGARPIAGSRRVQVQRETATTVAGRHIAIPPPAFETVKSKQSSTPPISNHQSPDEQHRSSSRASHELHVSLSTDSLRSAASAASGSHQSAGPSVPPRRESVSQQHQPGGPAEHQLFSLPVYSQDLGKLPLHGQLEFSSMAQPHYWYNSLQAPDPSGAASLHRPMDKEAAVNPAAHNHGSSISPHPSSEDLRGFAHPTNSIQPPVSRYSNQPYPPGPTNPTTAIPSGPPMYGGNGGPVPASAPRQPSSSSHMHIDPYTMGHPSSDPSFTVQPPSHQLHTTNNRPTVMRYPSLHQPGYVDNDTMAMWSNAPTGFELDEWGTYLMSMSGHPSEAGGDFDPPPQSAPLAHGPPHYRPDGQHNR